MEFAELIKTPRVDGVVLHRPFMPTVEGTLCLTGHHLILSSRQDNTEELWLLHANIDSIEKRYLLMIYREGSLRHLVKMAFILNTIFEIFTTVHRFRVCKIKIYVTLDHKTSHKGHFFIIEIYTSSIC